MFSNEGKKGEGDKNKRAASLTMTLLYEFKNFLAKLKRLFYL